MSEVRIARFVDMNACRSIFSDYSTFVLRSSEYYRRQYETDRGDKHELQVRCTDRGSAEMSCFALSCWTKLEGDEPTRDEWGIFRNSVVAIVSTPSKVCTFLEEAFEIRNDSVQNTRRYPFTSVEHKAVTYADEVPEQITPNNIMEMTVFTKRMKLEKQKEYRFALPFSMVPHYIDTYIFAKKPDYMETCFANPDIRREDKDVLRLILLDAMAGYGHFSDKELREMIANANVLF
ncbi:MAG: hypothetical protein JSU70_06340 [Phycisphaerales bacterium]|nr:MAG: hypothetical protein JSU70_06340 [Phycisphaerales bacterium]